MRNYAQSPRYQRALQKLRRLDPSQKAILDSAFIDKEFAQSEMGKTLQGMQLAIQRKGDEYTRKSAGKELDLRIKDIDRSKKDLKQATLIGGANVLASGYFGHQKNKLLKRLAGMQTDETKRINLLAAMLK